MGACMAEVLVAELAAAGDDVAGEADGTVGEVAGASERRDLNYAIGGICGVIFVFTILAVVNFSGAVGDEFGVVQAHIAHRGQPPAFPSDRRPPGGVSKPGLRFDSR